MMKTKVRSIGAIGLVPMVVYILGFSLAGVSGAFAQAGAAIVQYQQGVSPSGSYQHLGSEIRAGTQTNDNLGANDLMRSGSGQPLRTVLAFDLTGITSDMILTSVELELHANSIEGAGPLVQIHRIQHATHPMIEGTVTTFGGGPDPFGVTWNRVQNDGASDILWATPGGDFSATVLSSALVPVGGAFYTFASSPAFVAAAQDALVNNGGLLELIAYAPSSETFFGGFVRWDSDDATTTSFRPLLEVAFVPEPSIAALLGLGGLLLLWRQEK